MCNIAEALRIAKSVPLSHITIIGGGNLGRSIADGLLETGFTTPQQLSITRRKVNFLETYASLGVQVTDDNIAAAARANVLILAVKPYQALDVLRQLADSLKPGCVVVSVVTGVPIAELAVAAGGKHTAIRAMPNTAIAIRESMTCIASKGAEKEELATVKAIFDNLGKTVVIEEELMEAATVLGACGIAYALRFIRAATQGGIEIGFDAKTASLIAAQTAKGAAELLLAKGLHPEQEIDKVTTPQGCTIVGLNEMEHQGFSSSLIRGILASYRKIK